MKNAYNVNGIAYTDIICATTRKSMQEVSVELGFDKTYLKHVRERNRIRFSSAQLIEKMYGIPISPYIVPDTKPAVVEEIDGAIVYADDIVEAVYGAMLAYLDGNGDLKDFLMESIINYLESVAAQKNTVD